MAEQTQFTNAHDALAALRTKWQTAFPSPSDPMQSLREALIAADSACLHSRAEFQNFQFLLQAAAEPTHHWGAGIRNLFTSLKRQQAFDVRHFAFALKVLRDAQAAETIPATKQSQTPVTPPPEPIHPSQVIHSQIVHVTVTDGKVETSVDLDATFWCLKKPWAATAYVNRVFIFKDGVVPEPYAYVLTHDGVSYEPTNALTISYSTEEFARLCQLELDTGSVHLIDGERCGYFRHPNHFQK